MRKGVLISSPIKNAENNSIFPSNVNARSFTRKLDQYSSFQEIIESDKEIFKKYLETCLCLQPRVSWMASPHWLLGRFCFHCGLNYFLSTELCSRGHNSFFITDLAAVAEDCRQCCNNQEYYSEVVAKGLKPPPAASPLQVCSSPAGWAKLQHSLWDTARGHRSAREPTAYQPTLNSTWASKNPTTGEVAAFQPWILARISPSRLLLRTIFTRPGYLLFTYWSRLNFSSTARQENPTQIFRTRKTLQGYVLLWFIQQQKGEEILRYS